MDNTIIYYQGLMLQQGGSNRSRAPHFNHWIKTESEIADEHAGFRKGRGTRDLGFRKGRGTMDLRILIEKTHEHQQQVAYSCALSTSGRPYSVSHERLWFLVLKMGYPPHLVQIWL